MFHHFQVKTSHQVKHKCKGNVCSHEMSAQNDMDNRWLNYETKGSINIKQTLDLVRFVLLTKLWVGWFLVGRFIKKKKIVREKRQKKWDLGFGTLCGGKLFCVQGCSFSLSLSSFSFRKIVISWHEPQIIRSPKIQK